tara:strand:- start:8687 stop:8905 length:219 start_codon:yes stop_codon:yes gene_type:complete
MNEPSNREILDHVINILGWRRHEWDMKDRTGMIKSEIEMEMRFEAKDNAAIKLLEDMRSFIARIELQKGGQG